MIKKNGFTLVELLVVMAIMAIFGTLTLTILTNTLKGSNKSQVVGVIKQNGQSLLEIMDKTIRNADKVVCTSHAGNSVVVVKNGIYTRFTFIPPTATENGLIRQDSPDKTNDAVTKKPETDPKFVDRVCFAENDIIVNPITLTDTNTKSGVSANCIVPTKCSENPVFKREISAGFMDQITINFTLKPGIEASVSVAGQIDDANFKTTIQLR